MTEPMSLDIDEIALATVQVDRFIIMRGDGWLL